MLLLFCEQFVFPDHEYMSAFSSLFFAIISLFGLFASEYNHPAWKWLLSLIFTVGFGSFAYHWNKSDFNGMLDVVPMLLVIYLAVYLVLRVLIIRILFDYPYWRDKADDIAGLICSTCQVLSIAAYYRSSYDLPFLFGAPSIIMALLVTSFAIWVFVKERDQIPHPVIFIYILVAQIGVLLAAIFWIATETRCNYDKQEIDPGWIKYTFAHTWWHILLAFSTYYEIMFMQYCEIYDTRFGVNEGWGFLPRLKTSSNMVYQFVLNIIPIVEMGERYIV